MVLTYCIKEKKPTESVPDSEKYVISKNGHRMLVCICQSCKINKTKFVKSIEGTGLDIQKILAPLGEMHLRTLGMKKYQFCGPGTNLEKRLKRGDEGINRLDKVCKQHDIDYDTSKNLKDKHIADQKMIDAINQFQNKSITERAVKNVILMKRKLGGNNSNSKNVKSNVGK